MTKIAIALVPSLIVAFSSSYLTVKLALRRFYSEKWWERKAETYAEIMGSLSIMRNSVADLLAVEEVRGEISEERQKEINSQQRQEYDAIRKVGAMGGFIISEEAANCLKNLDRELSLSSEAHTYYEYLDMKSAALAKCLEALRLCAKRDLEIPLRGRQNPLRNRLNGLFRRRNELSKRQHNSTPSPEARAVEQR